MSSLLVEMGFDDWDIFCVCDEYESSLFFSWLSDLKS